MNVSERVNEANESRYDLNMKILKNVYELRDGLIKQEAVLGTYTIKIDKKDGRFDDDAGEIKKLRTVEGKTIEMELPNQSED